MARQQLQIGAYICLGLLSAVRLSQALQKNQDVDKSSGQYHILQTSSRDNDGSYSYDDKFYQDKTGGYGGSDLYSNKAGYGGGTSHGGGTSYGGGGGYGSHGGGGGGIGQIITSLGVLLSLLLAGLALGAAMFGPFAGTTSTTGIPTVTVPPGQGRSAQEPFKAGMGAPEDMLMKTRARFVDVLETVLTKYDVKGDGCRLNFVCKMYNKLQERQRVQDLTSEPNRSKLQDGESSSLIRAALDGSSGLDCADLYKDCDDDISAKIKKWLNELDNN